MTFLTRPLVLFAALLLGFLIISPASTSSAAPVGGGSSGLSLSEQRLLGSENPVAVILDASSGEVLSVDPIDTANLVTPMATSTPCVANRPCWNSYIGGSGIRFSGAVTNGSWSNRCSFSSGNRNAKVQANGEPGEREEVVVGVAEHLLDLRELLAEHHRNNLELLIHVLGIGAERRPCGSRPSAPCRRR